MVLTNMMTPHDFNSYIDAVVTLGEAGYVINDKLDGSLPIEGAGYVVDIAGCVAEGFTIPEHIVIVRGSKV